MALLFGFAQAFALPGCTLEASGSCPAVAIGDRVLTVIADGTYLPGSINAILFNGSLGLTLDADQFYGCSKGGACDCLSFSECYAGHDDDPQLECLCSGGPGDCKCSGEDFPHVPVPLTNFSQHTVAAPWPWTSLGLDAILKGNGAVPFVAAINVWVGQAVIAKYAGKPIYQEASIIGMINSTLWLVKFSDGTQAKVIEGDIINLCSINTSTPVLTQCNTTAGDCKDVAIGDQVLVTNGSQAGRQWVPATGPPGKRSMSTSGGDTWLVGTVAGIVSDNSVYVDMGGPVLLRSSVGLLKEGMGLVPDLPPIDMVPLGDTVLARPSPSSEYIYGRVVYNNVSDVSVLFDNSVGTFTMSPSAVRPLCYNWAGCVHAGRNFCI